MSPELVSNADIQWLRFWCPLGGEIRCETNGGFLLNPEGEYGKHANPNVSSLEALTPQTGPVVLCGEPGIGKSTELRFARERLEKQCADSSDQLVCVVFREVADFASFRAMTVETDQWAVWKDGCSYMTLVVDGVDEGLLRIGSFVNDLRVLLKNEAVDRLRLVLACRTAEWPVEQGRSLVSLWAYSNRQVLFELCPLRRSDVVAAATSRGCNSETFVAELATRNVESLAARPVTLFFLLSEFRRHGSLPNTHRQLYEIGTENLVREMDPIRLELQRSLQKNGHNCTDIQRLDGARRLAALFLLTGRSAVRLRGAAFDFTPANDLLLDDSFDSGSSASPHSISYAAVAEALESALFTSVGERRFGFAHQTFAECLAAQHLSKTPLVQLRRLIFQRDLRGEHVIPQLAELAAWLAGYHTEFCEYLLKIEPEVLIRSDVTRLQGSMKVRLVAAILEGAERNEIFDTADFEKFLGGLAHPGLADQLRSVLFNKQRGDVCRRIALSMAKHCKVLELVEEVFQLAADNEESQDLRESAASALEQITPEDRLELLEPLARGEVGPDPDDTIRGCALRRLVPLKWSVRKALDFLVPRSNENFIGSYHVFVEYEMPAFVTDDDVKSILIWLMDRNETLDDLHPFNRFALEAIRRAFDLLSQKDVASALVGVWLSVYEIHRISVIVHGEGFKGVFDGVNPVRLLFAKEFLNDPRVSCDDAIRLAWDGPVLEGEGDMDWLLDQLLECPEERQPVWACVVNRVRLRLKLSEAVWEKLLLRITEFPALKREFEWLRAWDLDEPIAVKARTDWARQREWMAYADQRKVRKPKPNLQTERSRILNDINTGRADAWFELWQVLAEGESGRVDLSVTNVLSYPGWVLLSEEEQVLCKEAARSYLIEKAAEAEGLPANTLGACAGAGALSLLLEEWRGNADLSRAITGPWFRVLVGRCCRQISEMDQSMFASLYEGNPERARNELFDLLKGKVNRHDVQCVLRVAKKCWDRPMSEGVLGFLGDVVATDLVLSCLEAVAECDAEPAASSVLLLLSQCVPDEEVYPIELPIILIGAMRIAPKEAYPIVVEVIGNDESLRRHVWMAVLHQHGFGGGGLFAALDERSLVEIYLILCDLFPPDQDPPWKGGDVTAEMEVRRMRGQIPALIAARATEDACSELLRLANLRPQSEWIYWTYRGAVTSLRRNLWQPPTVAGVKRMLQQPAARWINNEDDLLDLVLESLGRFQIHLTGQSLPAVETLWHWNRGGQARSNFKPKDEESISDDVARWLRSDVGSSSGVVVNREVQPRRGNRTDVIVEAIASDSYGEPEHIVVVIEVKGCWHAELKTALESQLVNDYLKPNGWRRGVYLVGWFICERWETPQNRLVAKNREDAATELQGYADAALKKFPSFRVVPLLLDCTF